MLFFDRFDICEAYILYGMLYHGGQWSKEYRDQCRAMRLMTQIRSSLSVETLSENARAIFDSLVERGGHEPYESEAA